MPTNQNQVRVCMMWCDVSESATHTGAGSVRRIFHEKDVGFSPICSDILEIICDKQGRSHSGIGSYSMQGYRPADFPPGNHSSMCVVCSVRKQR